MARNSNQTAAQKQAAAEKRAERKRDAENQIEQQIQESSVAENQTTVEAGSVVEVQAPTAPTDEQVAAALSGPDGDTTGDLNDGDNPEDEQDDERSGDEPDDVDIVNDQRATAETRAQALARLTGGVRDVPVEVAPIETPVYGSGRKVDWTSDDTDTRSTVTVTHTMVTHGYLGAYRGDTLTAPKAVADRLVKLGAAVRNK